MRFIQLMVWTWLVLVVFSDPAAAQTRAIHVPWLEDVPWSEVTRRAEEAPIQPILIDFYAQWCGPCKLLDAFVYNESEVIAELSDVVTFKVDIDKPEYFQLKKDFNITLLPTLIWCNPQGKEIDRFTGSVSPEEFLVIIRAIREGGNIFDRVTQLAAAKPEDPGLLFDLARRQAERGNVDEARVLYRRLMNLRYKADQQVVVDGMLGLAEIEKLSGNTERAVDLARRSSRVFGPDDPGSAEGLMAVAAYQGALGDTLGMQETYGNLIAIDERNVLALDAYARVAAQTGQDLEQASRYAIKAVVYSDNNPRMMETLASTYYSRGLYSKAIRWMGKAAAAEPDNAHFAEVLETYQKTLESAPYRRRGR